MAMPLEPRGCFAEWDGARLHVGFSGQGVWGLKRRARRQARPARRGGAGDHARRRRRLRHQGLHLPGIFRRRLRRARARPPGALDERPRRGDADRQRRPRPRHRRRGRLRRRLPAAGAAHRLRLQPRRLQRPLRPAHRLEAGAEGDARRLRRAAGLLPREGRLHQHHAARRLPRRRPAGGDLRHRAADGLVGARPRPRPGRAPPPELHPARRSSPTAPSRASSTTSAISTACSTARSSEADVAGFAARKAASARAGKLRGLGLSYYIEFDPRRPERDDDRSPSPRTAWSSSASAPSRTARATRPPSPRSSPSAAASPSSRIRFVQGDSDRIADGGGTGGSRSVTMQGNSINHAADDVIARFRPLAEEELEVAGADLVFEDGAFRVAGTDRAVGLMAARRGRAQGRQDRAARPPPASTPSPAAPTRTARISPRSRSSPTPAGPRW